MLVAGASPSIVRAAVMASVVLLARESGRAGRAPAALAWAAAALLLLSPEMIADAGFRLSVAATAGLLAWASPVGAALARLSRGHLPGWLTESLGISLAAQAATLPDVLATFGRLSLVAPAVNLLVVPIVPPAMGAGLLALLGGAGVLLGAPPWVAVVAGLPAWLLFHVMVTIVRIGAALPVAAVSIPPEAALPFGLLAAASIAAVLGWRHGRHARPGRRQPAGRGARGAAPASRTGDRRQVTPRRIGMAAWAVLAAILVVTLIGAGVVVSSTTRTTRLTVLDVGQGDSILLESARGARLLVDGGPDPARLGLLLDERLPPWDRRIDVIVLTHPHEDHVAGLVRVLERYAVGRVYEPGMRGPGPGWRAWDEILGRGSPPRGTLSTGQRLRLDEIRLDVLWPDPGSVPAEPGATGRAINDTSIVLLGTANGHRFLLTGDAEDDVDPVLVARGLPRVDVLKVAHHGSATATSQPLLDSLRPSVAVISVGAGNDYGHPASSTLDRLASVGAHVFRTDRDGTVSIDLAPGRVAVRTTGGRTGYDRIDDGPHSPYGRDAVALARAGSLVPAPRLRGRRRRGVAGARGRRARCRGEHPARRDRRAAARHRQAPRRTGGRSPPARRGIRGMAGDPWPRGARAGGARPSGDAACRGRVRELDEDRDPGGKDRRVCGQARRTAPGADGRTLRIMAPPVSTRIRGPGQANGQGGVERGDHAARGAARPRSRARRVRCGGGHPRAGAPPSVVATRAARGCPVSADVPLIAYYRGDDAYGIDHRIAELARHLQQATGAIPDRWRVQGVDTTVAAIGERVATAPMFGGGTLAVVADPAPLLRSKADREALEATIATVAPGNALVFVEIADRGSRRSAAIQGLETAVERGGGEVRGFKAPQAGELAAWIEGRAREREIRLAPGAARELARRVGGFVREGDIDRARQGALAVGELEKLALYRPSEPITEDDVAALVAEVVPDSTWALLDAIAERRAGAAGPALDRLLDTTPEPVVLAHLHRRLRELTEVAGHLASGATPGSLVRTLGMKPFRVDKLVGQARRWTLPGLVDALDALMELDAMVKGAPGSGATDQQRRLAFALWVRDHVALPAG